MAYAEITDGYIYIPKSALDDKFDAILIAIKKSGTMSNQRNKFEFWWNSLCNDGYYNLTITPRQIYFHSSHDNPNPNYLYWVINIDSIQYRAIRERLKSQVPKGFSNQTKYYEHSYVFHDDKFKDTFNIPNEWNSEKEKQFDAYCQKQIEQQLKRYFSILNDFIEDDNKKLKLPGKDEIEQIKPKLLSANKEELLDWRPHKFVPPALKEK